MRTVLSLNVFSQENGVTKSSHLVSQKTQINEICKEALLLRAQLVLHLSAYPTYAHICACVSQRTLAVWGIVTCGERLHLCKRGCCVL